MSNHHIYNSYQQPQQQYSPSVAHGSLNVMGTSPTFANVNYIGPSSVDSSTSSTVSSQGSGFSSYGSRYSLYRPRLRHYLSKSFDVEDDLEFCPEIPECFGQSPPMKKFNPYTATVFSPTSQLEGMGYVKPKEFATGAFPKRPLSPKVNTPRLKRPLEIINPQTKTKVESPGIHLRS